MKIEFHNCPEPEIFDAGSLPEAPLFLSYQPNFKSIESLARQYGSFSKLVIIGHGGSISSFFGIYHALREQSSKEVHFVSTIDPDYIAELKKFVSPADTLVIAISKSGETVTQIEALLQFSDFPLLVITSSMGPLAEIAEKLQAKVFLHPSIGGRFAGLTEVALVPAALCGLDIRKLFKAGCELYAKFSSGNEAFVAASVLNKLEEQGIVDVFMPIYDAHLVGLGNLIVQLCHESFGKAGKGQTYFVHPAPESQHHTNQRFFGGRKNMAGWFLSAESPLREVTTVVPQSIADVRLKDGNLESVNGIPLSQAMRAELAGTLEDAKMQNLPVINQSVTSRTEAEIGRLIAFWQLFAVYSSVLRKVNPFDQPQVENSKTISFTKRLNYKGKL